MLHNNTIKHFKQNKRAYYSALLFAVIMVLSLFSEFIANDSPLIVSYKNKLYFPIFDSVLLGKDWEMEDEPMKLLVKAFITCFANTHSFMLSLNKY